MYEQLFFIQIPPLLVDIETIYCRLETPVCINNPLAIIHPGNLICVRQRWLDRAPALAQNPELEIAMEARDWNFDVG